MPPRSRGHDRVDVIADVLDHGEAEADHGGVDHPVGWPVDLVAPPPQQAEQHQTLHRLLDHRRAERRRHVLAGARAERGHRHVLEVGGVDDERGQRRDAGPPDEREREVLPRLRLEPVHPQHQRDQQRDREQRQRQRDRERRRAVAEREGLHRVDPDGDERAGGGDRHADDEANRSTSRVTVREHRRRIERSGWPRWFGLLRRLMWLMCLTGLEPLGGHWGLRWLGHMRKHTAHARCPTVCVQWSRLV